MGTFDIFSSLPEDARVFVTLGDKESFASVGDYMAGVSPADFESVCRETVAALEAWRASIGRRDLVARSIYGGNGRARVEFRGSLEGLTLYIDTRPPDGAGADDVLNHPWVFSGARFESPENEYGGVDAAIRLVAAAAKVVELDIVSGNVPSAAGR